HRPYRPGGLGADRQGGKQHGAVGMPGGGPRGFRAGPQLWPGRGKPSPGLDDQQRGQRRAEALGHERNGMGRRRPGHRGRPCPGLRHCPAAGRCGARGVPRTAAPALSTGSLRTLTSARRMAQRPGRKTFIDDQRRHMNTLAKPTEVLPPADEIGNDAPPPAVVPAAQRWGSDVIVDLLHQYKMPYAALKPGASYRGLHDSIVNYGDNYPRMMLCQHEETAVQIAHGYAKASGKPMVAILHNLVGLL